MKGNSGSEDRNNAVIAVACGWAQAAMCRWPAVCPAKLCTQLATLLWHWSTMWSGGKDNSFGTIYQSHILLSGERTGNGDFLVVISLLLPNLFKKAFRCAFLRAFNTHQVISKTKCERWFRMPLQYFCLFFSEVLNAFIFNTLVEQGMNLEWNLDRN